MQCPESSRRRPAASGRGERTAKRKGRSETERPAAGQAGNPSKPRVDYTSGEHPLLRLPAVGDNAAMEAEPKRKRRWFQFSLRTLMILTLIVAIPCAWLGRKIEQKRREREAVAAIMKAGGIVVYDYQKPSLKSGQAFKPVEEPNGPALLRNLLGENLFSEVYAVYHNNAALSDDEIELLERFPHLQDLNLSGCHFRVAGLTRIARLTSLRDLALGGIRPPDDDVAGFDFGQLKALTQLEGLALGDTSVSDLDLAQLKELRQLTNLFLYDSNVTDSGLEELKGLIHLKFLAVDNPNVTPEGEKRIRAALPNCSFGHSPKPRPKPVAPAARGRG
jgi:Leucine-rich repeat (LRR) protein